MSDLEVLISMLISAGYEETTTTDDIYPCGYEEDPSYLFCVSRPAAFGHEYPVSLDVNKGEGYSGFVVSFFFDSDGKLLRHAVWE